MKDVCFGCKTNSDTVKNNYPYKQRISREKHDKSVMLYTHSFHNQLNDRTAFICTNNQRALYA